MILEDHNVSMNQKPFIVSTLVCQKKYGPKNVKKLELLWHQINEVFRSFLKSNTLPFFGRNKHFDRTFCRESISMVVRVSVQGVESLSSYFAKMCWEFDFHEKKILFIKKKGK